MIDYSDVYNGYWQRADRLGESSFDNATPIARQILSTCGPGKMLDIGCGMGALVRELLKHGVDAQGVDVSSFAIQHCRRAIPDRFQVASALALPFPDDSLDSVISTDCLEHLSKEDVALALQEMHRVTKRNLFLCVATELDRDGHWHLTVEKRAWWETAAFTAGFRKHPRYYEILPFHTLETEGNSIVIPLEKISSTTLREYPLSHLYKHRELHMDMSRETGRRSDAHMARYQLAATYVRDGDTVLDAACGLGYGSHLLSRQSSATKIIGADLDKEAVLYASKNFDCDDERLSFRVGDAQQLSFLPDNSIDLFVSFETLEHIPHPEHLIAEAKRILRPSGRFIVSVPNLWVNEEGIDPNPHHLHVYCWERLVDEIQSHFLLEAAYAQIAGGGMKLTKQHRSLFAFPPEGLRPEEAEWWIVVGMKDPIEAKTVRYEETAFHWTGEAPNAIAFSRDYENPWLVRSIISIGWRNRNPIQRTELAKRTLETSTFNSPDTGAALCVLAYSLLESNEFPSPASIQPLADKIDAFIRLNDPRPQCRRWCISLMFVQGLLWKAIGQQEEAIQQFRLCAEADALAYSPLLATKTVGSCEIAGKILFQTGRHTEAKAMWVRGVSLAKHALEGNWREIYGDIQHPFPFGLAEVAEILEIASRCADGIRHLEVRASCVGLPDNGSVVARINSRNTQLEEVQRSLDELRASPPARLQRALKNDPKSFKRSARIVYLLAIIIMPARLQKLLHPLADLLRRKFL